MSRKRLRAVLFGPQGCGKGTQGQLLSERFDVPLIGAGDLMRQEMAEQTSLGRLIKEYVDQGMLAPDELVNAIIQKQMKAIDLERGFILDGYPRNVEQAASLDRFAKIGLAIQIKISDAEALRRLLGRRQCQECRSIFHVDQLVSAAKACALCGGKLIKRGDDEEQTIMSRLAVYHFMTEPMTTYYRQRGVLLCVNGEQSIAELFHELVKKIIKLGFVIS
ncbi:MAG: nucleoside monophosphate kinase [Patescibacteria group bacterium]